MLQNTTQRTQAMGSGDARMKEFTNNDADVVHSQAEATTGGWITSETGEEMLADDTQGDRSTVSTELSHMKGVFSSPPSPILGPETDPTSMPSGIIEDLELERKGTTSPLDSLEAVYGSDSVHSTASDPSVADSDLREGVPVAVNASKVRSIGDHFGDSSTDNSTPRFHDPKNSWEAQRIKDKIRQANANMDDIELHPEEGYRNHGSAYQLSARPENPAASSLSVEDDIAHKSKLPVPPGSRLQVDIEEGDTIEGPTNQRSRCCTIL